MWPFFLDHMNIDVGQIQSSCERSVNNNIDIHFFSNFGLYNDMGKLQTASDTLRTEWLRTYIYISYQFSALKGHK